jgi:hypothetical protein
MPRTRQRLPAALWFAAFALCLLHAWLAVAGQARVGPAFDEPIHVASGRAYWQAGDFRFQPENGNLPQRWQALPLLDTRWNFPTSADLPESWINADPWRLSRTWFFERDIAPEAILGRARLMNSLLGATLCAVVFLWSTSLFGPAGGFLSLGLAVFCPNLLAHAGLATSDTSAALFFSVVILAWWRLLHRVSPARILAAGLATGALALAKYSAVLLAPVVVILLIARLTRRTPLACSALGKTRLFRTSRRAAALACAAAAAVLLAWGLVWAAYDFRAPASARGPIVQDAWDAVLLARPIESGWAAESETADAPVVLRAGPLQHGLSLLRASHVLPEAWVYGFAYVARHSMARAAYLNGEYSSTGFRTFFPVAFALKTPEAGLLALALGLATLLFLRPRRPLYRLLPVAVFLVVYWAFALTSTLNIGYRHLLPVLPFCWLLAGALALAIPARRRAVALLAFAIVAAQAAASLLVAPHYLAYFNTLGGGPAGGHRHLVDSSLDWGQGLPELDRWLRARHQGEPLHLSYFGSDDPARFPWTFTRLADAHFDSHPRPKPAPMRGGLYCIGATQFRRVYTPAAGPWTTAREARYRKLTTWFAREDLTRADDAAAPLSAADVSRRLTELEHLRFARLCLWLDTRPPAALIAGGSLLVFRVTDAELAAVLTPSL